MGNKRFLVIDGTVQVHGKRINEYIDFINTHNFKSVYVNSLRYEPTDINFLKECTQIEELSIGSPYITDFSELYKLKNLKSLGWMS